MKKSDIGQVKIRNMKDEQWPSALNVGEWIPCFAMEKSRNLIPVEAKNAPKEMPRPTSRNIKDIG